MSLSILFYHRADFKSIAVFFSDKVIKSLSIVENWCDRPEYTAQECIIDLSSVAPILNNNENSIYTVEKLLDRYKDYKFIADIQYRSALIDALRLIINEEDCELFSDNSQVKIPKACDNISPKKIRKITDLSDVELETFFYEFNAKFHGHELFKQDLRQRINSFRVFNKLGEHKVFSLFLMGSSGIGKTEVARCMLKCLKSNKKLAKISFGNYSSKDALNSLIGSPRGYIGSDGGELIHRLNDSDVGLILIDEFEKGDTPIFNYFLDVLENGKIVNSLGDEYDINGYIIIFTSNISTENFHTVISPELKSRFDYVGKFSLLTFDDKMKFVKSRASQILELYYQNMKTELPSDTHKTIVDKIDVNQYTNMRELNKSIKDTFCQYLSAKKI